MSTPNATPAANPTPFTGRRRRGELRTKIADSALLQAVIAGALSFTHIHDVAMMAGQNRVAAWAYPFIVDLLTMSAYRKLKRNEDAGQPTGMPWTIMMVGTVFSLAANIIDALAHAPLNATPARLTLCVIIGVWPAVAFFASMLLRHSGQPADRPAAAQPVPVKPAGQPTAQPIAPVTRQRPADQPAAVPPLIPVKPIDQPQQFAHLGPRADVGELPMHVWVEIGRPVYQQIKTNVSGRPTEKALQAALSQRVAELITAGKLPAAIGQPSGSTAKRIRRAIETQHPELTARTDQPRRLAIASN